MSNQPNLNFSPDEPAIKAFMEQILLKSFANEGLTEVKEQAKFCQEQSQEIGKGRKITASWMGKNLLGPYNENKPISLSLPYLDAIDNLIHHLKKSKIHQEHLILGVPVLNAFKEYVKSFFERIKDPLKFIEQMYGDQSTVKFLDGSKWHLYERIGKKQSPLQTDWGIAVGIVDFTTTGNYTSAEVRFKNENSIRRYEGIASKDPESDYLYLDLSLKEGGGKRAHMSFRLDETEWDKQQLLLGMFCFHSKSYGHLLTKTVIMERVEQESHPTQTAGRGIAINEYMSDEEEFIGIDENIRKLFYNRELNRMSFPDSIISNLNELSDFLETQRASLESQQLMKQLCGTYQVIFNLPKIDLKSDTLQINYDVDALALRIEFTHILKAKLEKKKTWVSETCLEASDHFVVLSLHAKKSGEDKSYKKSSPLSMVIHLPQDELSIEDCDFFPGMLIGLNDAEFGRIGCPVILLKQGLNYDEHHATIHSWFTGMLPEKKFIL
jgi:hypothetical protein